MKEAGPENGSTAYFQRHFLCHVLTCPEHMVLPELHVLLIIPYSSLANGWHQLFNLLVGEILIMLERKYDSQDHTICRFYAPARAL